MRMLLLGLAVALGGGGCLVPVRSPDRQVRVDASRVAAVDDSLRAASGPARLAVVARQLADAGLTPLADGSFRAGLGRTSVAGLVPGREPVARPSLVVVGAAADGPEAAVVLEAARLLVGRSRYEVVPEQSVLFVLWDNALAGERAIQGLGRSPIWPRDRVTSALVVGAGPHEGAMPVVSVRVDGPASVEPLLARIVEAARRPETAPGAP